ncbi:MAG TPA: T3SS effector HopA1 family protein [Microlunatus sp.]
MPLVNAPGQIDLAEESPLGRDLRSTPTRAADALADVRGALALIAGDVQARGLLAETGPDPDPEGALAGWLYGHWWCGPDAQRDQTAAEPNAATRGAALLEAARRTVAPTSAGWLVLAAAGDVLVAARATGRLRTVADAVVGSSRPGCSPRPGDLVTLQHGSSGLDPSGAWWWAHADRPEDLAEVALDRWYVHARDLATASAVVPVLLAVAAEVGCSLSLKCPPVAQGYGRRDVLVAYLPRRDAAEAEVGLRRRADRLARLLAPDVPPCTRRLLPGVAHAEDPGAAAVSYGQLRCSQVAALAARLGGCSISDRLLTAALAELEVDVHAVERVLR